MSSDASRLILFDIDQTLIFTAGAGLRCMAQAILEVAGIDMTAIRVNPGGKTDPAILYEIFDAAGVSTNGQRARVEAEVWRRYAECLGEEMERADERRAVKPGIPSLLDALQPHASLGLLTGNLEVTARIKLAAFDLNRYFPIGAYGSDSHDRNALGALALARAAAHYGRAFAARDTWVVGDTDRDIACAKAIGARVLAVATGHQDVETLRAHAPDVVLEDMADVESVKRVLLTF